MMQYQATIDLVRGDDEPLELCFTDLENHKRPLPIEGYKVFLTIKKDARDSDEDALLRKAMVVPASEDADNGVVTIEITDDDWDTGYKGNPVPSGLWPFDVSYVDTQGKPKTVLIGTATVIQDVTHGTEVA